MRVNIKISQQNYLEFNVYHITHLPGYYRSVALMALVVPLAIGVLAFFVADQMQGYTWVWLLLAGVVSIYWVVTTPARFRRQVRKQVLKMTGNLDESIGEFCLELGDDKLEYTGKNLHVIYGYQDLNKVVWNRGCYYLMLGETSALMVPETSFASQLSEQEFLDKLREKSPQAQFKII